MEPKSLTINEVKDAKLRMENYIGCYTAIAIQVFHKTTGLYPSSINTDLVKFYRLGGELPEVSVERVSAEISL